MFPYGREMYEFVFERASLEMQISGRILCVRRASRVYIFYSTRISCTQIGSERAQEKRFLFTFVHILVKW